MNDVDFAILHASQEGRRLYESLGFTAGNEMRIKLRLGDQRLDPILLELLA